jgi:hypothetical protein
MLNLSYVSALQSGMHHKNILATKTDLNDINANNRFMFWPYFIGKLKLKL